MESKTQQEPAALSDTRLHTHGIRTDEPHLPRNKVVKDILKLAREKEIIFLTSPPATGKTSLLQLIQKDASKDGASSQLFSITTYTTMNEIKGEIMNFISSGGNTKELTEANPKELFLLFDDAQNWYEEKYLEFWELFTAQFRVLLASKKSTVRCSIIVAATHEPWSGPETIKLSTNNFDSIAHFRKNGLWISGEEIEVLFATHTGSMEAREESMKLMRKMSRVGDNQYHIGVVIQGIIFLREDPVTNVEKFLYFLGRCFHVGEQSHTVECDSDNSDNKQSQIPYVNSGILITPKMKFSCLAACCYYYFFCVPNRPSKIPNSIEESIHESIANLPSWQLQDHWKSNYSPTGTSNEKACEIISLIDSDTEDERSTEGKTTTEETRNTERKASRKSPRLEAKAVAEEATKVATLRKSPRIQEQMSAGEAASAKDTSIGEHQAMAKQNYPIGTRIQIAETRAGKRVVFKGEVENYDPYAGLYHVVFEDGEWNTFDDSELKEFRVPSSKSAVKKQSRKKVSAKPSSKGSKHTQYRSKARSISGTNPKNGQFKRSVDSRPTSVHCLKDRTVRTKFELCAKNVSQLQLCNTMEDENARNFHPKSQHIMMTYDELVPDPENAKYGITRREEPIMVFLVPEGLDLEAFGEHLIRIGTEMIKGSGKEYFFASSPEEYSEFVFGPKKTQGQNSSS